VGTIQSDYRQSFVGVRTSVLGLDQSWTHGHYRYAVARLDSWRYNYVKRVIDFLLAFFLTGVLLVPGALIALAILITSSGPVFYREERIGRGGRPFRIWKFRTMRHNHVTARSDHVLGEANLEWRTCKDRVDPRITNIGALLRAWSLDELPQLLNILRGEMSIVGPRPIVAGEAPLYGELFAYYLAATPGLTGKWQVSGRSNVVYPARAELDASYVRSWNLKADIDILYRTAPAVLNRTGAR
jgi:exopolysaccharide production protein ExoY